MAIQLSRCCVYACILHKTVGFLFLLRFLLPSKKMTTGLCVCVLLLFFGGKVSYSFSCSLLCVYDVLALGEEKNEQKPKY